MYFKGFLFVLSIATFCEPAKILYVMPFTAPSHYISQKDLPVELAKRGHDVYVISAYKEPNPPPNYHEIKIDSILVWDALFGEKPNVFTMNDLSYSEFQNILYRAGNFFTEFVFNSSAVRDFYNQDHSFDLVINELFFQEAFYMFAHKYNAPLVLLTTFGNSFKGNYYGRNPLQLSTVYHEYGAASDTFSFIGRLKNLYYCMYDLYKLKFEYLPKQEEYARNYFSDLQEPLPSLEELASKAALVLMNNHFSIDVPAAYLPNYIEVGGLNHKAPQALPKDLQDILDYAKHGIVYLNFGSNVATSDLTEEQINAFINVFGELKETVLMKWENDAMKNLPKNIIIRKWFPQRDILAHPKVKLFIGHGGLIGLMEAISSGVPVIGVPVYGDQYVNLVQAVNRGFGIILNFSEITEGNVRSAVNRVLQNKQYQENARLVSKRFSDRPMSGLDTAVWWIEYVIRHKGADFMKTPALKMNFLERNMLDVYLFLFALILITVYTVIKFMRVILSSLIKKEVRSQKKRQ